MSEQDSGTVTVFRWRYIILPVSILLLTFVLIGIFYSGLSGTVAYTFDSDGDPVRSAAKAGLVLAVGGIQAGLTLAAFIVTRSILAIVNRYTEPGGGNLETGSIISLMGNMVAIPQAVIFFTMIDIFSYNSNGTHLMPLWLNALIFLLAGGVILSIFFIRALIRIRRGSKELNSD